MTWPYKMEPQMYTKIKNTYEETARIAKAKMVVLGTVWQTIQADQEVNKDLYDLDGVHHNILGTYLTSALFMLKFTTKTFLAMATRPDWMGKLPTI